MGDAYPTTSVTKLASDIRSGKISPVEVVEGCFSRIERFDPSLNAFISIDRDGAIRRAQIAEEAVSADDRLGPLHGVPIAIKDLTPVAGMKTTFGSQLFANNISKTNDIFVDRLANAGAIIVGKTNTPEFGRLTVTTNEICDVTRNPWDQSRTVGGSSGGSAAAVAAGLVPAATGTDAAGSIRIPAAACGVFGFFPDFGRIPVSNRPDAYTSILPYSGPGPITRSVSDAAILMDVMSGPHPTDPFSLPEPRQSFETAIDRSISELECAYSRNLGISTVSTEVESIIDEQLTVIESSGISVKRVAEIFTNSWTGLHDALEVLLQFRYLGIYEGLKESQGIDILKSAEPITPEVKDRIEKALDLDPIEIRRAERVRTSAIDDIRRLFAEFDLLFSPTICLPAFPVEERPSIIEGESIDPLHGWALTWPFNLTGNPAASIPFGFTSSQLPVGLQIIGPKLSDHLVMAACASLERRSPWRTEYSAIEDIL